MGAGVKSGLPEFGGAKRLLVVSPFLSDARISTIAGSDVDLTLVSRAESLDGLLDSTFHKLMKAKARIYAMDEGVEHPNEVAETEPTDEDISEAPDTSESATVETGDRLSGLHAKLYVAEYGIREVHLWTGSANATSPAFNGDNVEFMVGLWGRRRDIGIDRILGEKEPGSGRDATSLLDLLSEYKGPAATKDADQTAQELEDTLDRHRKLFAAAKLLLTARKTAADGFDRYDLALELRGDCDVSENVSVKCRPISLAGDQASSADPLLQGKTMVFRNLPASRLTRFVAFHLVAGIRKQKASLGFVLKVEARGFPEDRDIQILRSIISNTEQFLKYLLYVLGDGDMPPGFDESDRPGTGARGYGLSGPGSDAGLPLFEHLLKAFSRSPKNIVEVNKVIQDMQKHGDGRKIIPEDFLAMWGVLYTAHREQAAS